MDAVWPRTGSDGLPSVTEVALTQICKERGNGYGKFSEKLDTIRWANNKYYIYIYIQKKHDIKNSELSGIARG